MKTHLLQTAVAALTLAAAGYAQSTEPLRVNVPFDFIAGNRTLPAGQYSVSHIVNAQALAIQPLTTSQGVLVITNRIESPRGNQVGRLVFHRYGDRYYLGEVWHPYTSAGSQTIMTAQERELQRSSRKILATIFVVAH